MKKYINQAITAHKNGSLEEAETFYRDILKENPKLYNIHNNLGLILLSFGKLEEAEISFNNALNIKPEYSIAHNNLGSVLQKLKKYKEAELSFKKAIKINLNYAEAYNNLSGLLKILGKLRQAENNARKAIKLKPDLAEAYSNLGNILKDLGKSEESELNSRKALEFNQGSKIFKKNLDILLKQNKLLSLIKKEKNIQNDKLFIFNLYLKLKKLFFNKKVKFNKFITHLKVDPNLAANLYKINSKALDQTKDQRYGNGKCSDFNLFNHNSTVIKNLEKDLIKIISHAVKSDIFIMESFFNIFKTGSGITPHDHITSFDKAQGLINQKYSLTYYLSIGDQESNEPGILKLQEPNEKILPSEGTIVIFPAYRKHSAIYDGKKDRIMVGVNFYSLT